MAKDLQFDDKNSAQNQENATQANSANRGSQLLVIDTAVADYQLLQSALQEGVKIAFIDSDRDGVEQLSEILSRYSNLEAVHVVSHGGAGKLYLGNTEIDSSNLDAYAPLLQQWRSALTDEADILLYGCSVAGTEEGNSFIQRLSSLTGADVAASDDLTGSAAKGGDWLLEAVTGNIEAPLPFQLGLLQAYSDVLLGANPFIRTVAGNGTSAYGGDGGPATAAQLVSPASAFADSAGNIYIADQGGTRVRKIDAVTGNITTIAGTGTAGFSGDGGLATSAQLGGNLTHAIADSAGNVYIADLGNQRVRKVDAATGIITTIAGTGVGGYSGDGGLATAAQLKNPIALALNGNNLYIADNNNNRIRKIDLGTGIISTYAGTGIYGTPTADGLAASATNLNYIAHMAFDSAGNLYYAESDSHRIRKIDAATQTVTTIAGNGTSGFSGDGGAAVAAQFNFPFGIALDSSGNLYVSDENNNRIRKIDAATGNISTIAGTGTAGYGGDGGVGASAQVNDPYGIGLDSGGRLYFGDRGNARVRVLEDAPDINVTGNSVSIVSGDTTPDVADGTDFGSTLVTSGTVVKTFSIENLGGTASAKLDLTGGVTITGANAADFTVTAAPASTSIASGTPTTFQIAFDPSAAGVRTATVNIASNDLDETAYTFDITGTGTALNITSVSVPPNATYGVGQNLDFTVTFSDAVTIAQGAGSVVLPIALDTGGTVNATLVGTGASATTHTFRYTVAAGNIDTNGIALGTALVLSGGATVKDASNNDADLTLNGVAATTGVLVEGALPTAPVIASFSTDSGTAGDGITNSNTLTLTGTAEANKTVTVFQGAANLGTATADASGNWTFTTATLTDGSYAFTATASDALGNASAPSAPLNVTVETAAPAAALAAPNPTKDTPSTTFTVTYTDATAVDVASLDGSDIRVTGPNGYDQLATFVSASPSTNGTSITATYQITAPGGSWNVGANGTYTVAIAASQAIDIAGNAVVAADLGTFAVNIPNTPPTVGVAIASQTAALGQPFNFQVPADAFSETDPGDSLTYSATLADGSPLPAWLTLDPATGTFSGTPADLASYNITVTATDKAGAAVSSSFALQANYDKEQAAQTVELGLDKLEESLDTNLLAANLPVAGNNLKASAPTLLDDLARLLGGGLRSANVLNESNLLSIVQQAIAAEYPDAQVTGTTDPSEGTVQINFTKEFDVTTALSDNLGLPALGLTASGNGNTKYAYDFSLGLGINKDYGLYIDPAKSSLSVNTTLGFDPAFTARSTMGLVPVDYIIDPANPSEFVGDYSGSFQDLDNLGLADDGSRLTLAELQSQFDLATLFGTAVNNSGTLGLKGTTNNAGDAAIPTYTFDLKVGADSATGEPPSVEVNNVVLDLGTFISDFAKPIFQKINEVIEPFRPVIDVLNTDTKIFSEVGIADLFDRNGDGKVSVLELAATVANATFDTSFFDAITKIDEATRIVNEIANAEGTIQIKRGDFTLDDIDVTSAADLVGATISQVGVEPPTEKTYSILGFELEEREDTPADERTKVENFFRAINALQGIGLPILTDPKSAVGLLIGKPDVPLFTYDMPALQLNLSVSKDFPMWGPISGLLEGEFKGRAYLKFGYDTWGLTQWKQSNWAAADSYKVLDGFYVSDRENADGTGEDVPELSLEATIAAGVGVSAVVAEAYLKGGIQGTAEIDFRDVGEDEVSVTYSPMPFFGIPIPIVQPGTGDGKIRAGEITSRLAAPWELFQTEGSIDVFLAAEVETGVSVPFLGKVMKSVWSKNLATFNLAKFTLGPEGNSFTTAWDGYMAGGEVFFDANFNGVRDSSEPGTFTNVDGSSSLDVPLPQFDINGNGTLDPGEGRIVMADAVDVATLLPQATPLYTLPGWAAISPLTTIAAGLVLLGNSVADAQAKVGTALGLPAGVDVTQYDALTAMASGDANGLAVFAAAIQVQNTLVHIAKYADATSQASIQAISDATIAAISTKLNAGTPVNFADQQVILELFQAAIANVGQIDPALNTAQLLSAASAAATVTALGNQIVQEIAASGASPADAALKITQLQAVSVGQIAIGLADLAAGTVTPEQFLANNTKEAIQERMLQVPVNNPTVRPVIGEEVNEPYNPSTPGETPIPFPPVSPIGEGNVSTTPTPEADSLTGSDDAEEIFALEGDDTVLGNGGSDVINGNQGNDTIDGGSGDDFIYGGKDADTMTGSAGNDTLYGNLGTDSIEGGDGNDLLNGNQNEDWVDGGAGDDTVNGGKDGDTVLGGAGNDLAIGDRGADSVVGGDGDDVMFGNTGNDILDGGAGNDLIFGGKDSDTILGGEGNDVLFGDMGDDSVLGGDGDDVMFGNTGSDLLDGGAGNDTAYGGKDNDTVLGGSGNDFLWGDMGDDSASGGEGNDVLYGNTGSDSLDGGAGDDSVYGGKDADALTGGEGNDWLSGDLGNDTLTGGAGSDRFVLTATGASDAIADFEDGTDKLVLGVGLTFAQLSVAASGSATAIAIASTNELLATLDNVQPNLITEEDFALI